MGCCMSHHGGCGDGCLGPCCLLASCCCAANCCCPGGHGHRGFGHGYEMRGHHGHGRHSSYHHDDHYEYRRGHRDYYDDCDSDYGEVHYRGNNGGYYGGGHGRVHH